MPTKPKKARWGGSRPGAGRPKKVITPWANRKSGAARPEDAEAVERVVSALAEMTAAGGNLAWFAQMFVYGK